MRDLSQTSTVQAADALRGEARLLSTAGLIVLAIGFPLTLALAVFALPPEGLSPILPIGVGIPPLLLGYVACHVASERLAKAKTLESAR